MKQIAVFAFVLALLGPARAQPLRGGITPVQSSSGQFIVYGPLTVDLPSHLAGLSANTNYIILEPTLLAVSCERIKRILWLELGATAPWRGRIYLNLHPAGAADEWVTIVSEKFADGWTYRVELPNLLARDRFLRAMAQVLLVEMANRGNPTGRSAEIPLWLVEGLSRDMRASSGQELILQPPRWSARGLAFSLQEIDARWVHPLTQAREEFRARPPLTFEQLSWPAPGQLAGAAAGIYGSSAQLFVSELLRLNDGPACIRTLLNETARHYNWQLAFQDAFRSHFQNALDVEKWWALRAVQFTGRDLMQTWSPDESLAKLAEVIRPRVDVRAGTQELPLHSDTSLQTVVREWDEARQVPMLQRKVVELDLLGPRVAPEVAPLVDDYRRLIRSYLQKRSLAGHTLSSRKPSGPVTDRLAEETLNQLDALDARREALRPSPPPPVTAATETAPATPP